MTSNHRIFKRNWRQIYIMLAICIDTLATFGSAVTAYWIRNSMFNLPPLPQGFVFNVFLLCWFSFFSYASMLGLYRAAYHTHMREQYAIGLRAYLYSIPTILSLFYVFQIEDFPRRFMMLFFLKRLS
ncbi:MAG: hypothetical protein MUF54_05115, partial [Polyangiaceae bacterium]|nr:hypothetical protein [Polyangiaceae bacterium]